MKAKILFIRMLWSTLIGRQQGWVFFRLNSEQQRNIIKQQEKVEITVRYVKVDKRVIEKIKNKLDA